ncbi:preprotein translocase subunit YajC [Nocardiopsis sp. CNR-923]|uniref:preprotein translocase subunit YajC n=1 Tax=Nocardiopsis sp. CNR-923 TaxID=1904965 RepID=UPI00096735F9|nr:preprotein translocase subunit YajC [Nocardiopsis sp. CNR-923]OLT29080.1 preprotein translocase subunit YajC [Nocardiopsis sp. CNR-923]
MQGIYTLAAEGEPTGGLLNMILPFALILLVFWLLFWRPNQKRRQQESQMMNALVPGVEVMTKAGIFATVVEVNEQDVLLEIAPGTRIRMLKAGVGEVITPPADDTPVEDRPDFGDDDKPNS